MVPTYEYACKKCGEHLEVQQSFKDAALTKCPACGGVLRKVFGSIGIAFKGSGFYKTDSRKTSNGASKSVSKTDDSSKAAPAASASPSGTATSSGSSSSSSSSDSTGTTSDKKPSTAAAAS